MSGDKKFELNANTLAVSAVRSALLAQVHVANRDVNGVERIKSALYQQFKT